MKITVLMEKRYDAGTSGMTTVKNVTTVPDDFRHEQYLLIEKNGKKVLISGCSYKGILDVVALFKIDVIIGGFHFSKFPLDDVLKSYAEILDIRLVFCNIIKMIVKKSRQIK